MFVVLIILALAVAGAGDSGNYYLSPASLPTAYQGQYYTVQFRVSGLAQPVFLYNNLPSDFTGSENGTLQGTPSMLGSFPIEVTYSSGNISSGTNIVMQVSAALSVQQLVNSSLLTGFQVITPSSSFTYTAGSSVYIQLQAKNGRGPYIWSVTNLPPGVYAGTSGVINGSFIQDGYYTVSVQASDTIGETAYAYYVFNVQPANAGGQLVEVESRNPQMQYNFTQVEQQEVAATKAVYSAAGAMNQAQGQTTVQREIVAETTTWLVGVTQIATSAEAKVNGALNAQGKAQGLVALAQVLKQNASNLVALANTGYNNAFGVHQSAQQLVNEATSAFQRANQTLQQTTIAFIAAQNDSMQAASTLKSVLSQNILAAQTYASTFSSFINAKNILSAQQISVTQASAVVQSSQTAVSLATQSNDNAESALIMAQTIYQKANSILSSANDLVASFTGQLSDASAQLGQAKFNLQQAMDNLQVAQAVKAQADKATMLVSMQSAALPSGASGVDSTLFGGCEQGAYPSVGGSVVVQQVEVYGYALASGSTMLFGGCTVMDQGIVEGDLVGFEGYLKDGFIMALRVQKGG